MINITFNASINQKSFYLLLKCSTIYNTIYKKGEHKSAKHKKLIEKMKQQPNGIRPEEIDKVLTAYGYIPARQKGSHKHYLNKETGDLITIKQENPLKKAYVVDELNRIEE